MLFPMKPRHDVENTVRRHRRLLDLTQQQLARRVGVTRQTILSIEKGRYAPSVGLALSLAAVLEAPVESLFRRRERESPGGG
jgi:putative transcriptional regulator